MRSASLPAEADVVIIGSGITGCSVANALLSQNSTLRVVLLEARTITSGATGRNGGHIKETPFHEYEELAHRFGKNEAKKLVKFRLSHLDALVDFTTELGEDALRASEIRKVLTVDAFFDQVFWEGAKEMLNRFLDDFPEEAGKYKTYEKRDAAEVGYPHFVAVIHGADLGYFVSFSICRWLVV